MDLGGSPNRCAVAPPPCEPPEPELVRALVLHYRTERAAGREIEVGFFRGGLPSNALLEAARPHSVRLATHPGDLDQPTAKRLRASGVRTVEIEAWTFSDRVLAACRRGYDAAHVRAMVRGLRALGLRVGLVLVPGLPGSSHADAVLDAAIASELLRGEPQFVRICPALAFEGTTLARWIDEGRYRPMRLGEAVTTVAAMMDEFDRVGVPVARVGLQPGPDLPNRLVAGPWHPNLRGLVEGKRYRHRMVQALGVLSPRECAVVRVHPDDLAWARGRANENVRAVQDELRLGTLEIVADPGVPRGRVATG